MVYIKVRAFGWAEQYYDEDGRIGDMNIDDVRYVDSRTIRCAGCQEARADLAFAGADHAAIIRR